MDVRCGLVVVGVLSVALWLVPASRAEVPDGKAEVRLTTIAASPTWQTSQVLPEKFAELDSFVVDIRIAPTERTNGDLQCIVGILIGLDLPDADPFTAPKSVKFELREGEHRGFWDVWIDGANEPRCEPSPKPPGWVDDHEYQKPWEFIRTRVTTSSICFVRSKMLAADCVFTLSTLIGPSMSLASIGN